MSTEGNEETAPGLICLMILYLFFFLGFFQDNLDGDALDLHQASDRHFMLQIALKCADICNPCRPWEVSRAWSLQVRPLQLTFLSFYFFFFGVSIGSQVGPIMSLLMR